MAFLLDGADEGPEPGPAFTLGDAALGKLQAEPGVEEPGAVVRVVGFGDEPAAGDERVERLADALASERAAGPDAGYPAATSAMNTTNATPRWRPAPASARPYERRAALSGLSLRTSGAAGSCGKRKRERCLGTKSARAAGPGERHRP